MRVFFVLFVYTDCDPGRSFPICVFRLEVCLLGVFNSSCPFWASVVQAAHSDNDADPNDSNNTCHYVYDNDKGCHFHLHCNHCCLLIPH